MHSGRNLKYVLLILFLVTFISACGVKRLYNGDALKPSQIAILRHPVRSGGAEIVNIDNAYSESEIKFRSAYELLPGPHTLEVMYFDGFGAGVNHCFFHFDAKPGKEYQVIGYKSKGKWGAILREYPNGWSEEERNKPYSEKTDILCSF